MRDAEKAPELTCECGKPFALVRNGALYIMSVHSGEKHWNMLTLEQVKALLEQQQETRRTPQTM